MVAHAGGAGWDEILLVAGPVALFGLFLWLERAAGAPPGQGRHYAG